MRELLTVLIDLVFPPSVGEKILRDATESELLRLYNPNSFNNIEYIYSYSDTIIKTAVTENKFHHNKRAARILGKAIDKWSVTKPQPILFIPIPLGKKRLRQRGHNQVETILEYAAEGTDINKRLLQRSTETTPQSHLNKLSRQKNIRGVFTCTQKVVDIPAGTLVVLVDDVVTTGATMLEARATLAPHLPTGVTLTCLALAH